MTDMGLSRRLPARPIEFTYPGALALSTSGNWAPDHNAKVYGARALLATAGTSNTIVTVYVNGTSVGTITLGSGVKNKSAAFTAATLNTESSAGADDNDVLSVGVTTVGTGAKDLVVLVRVA